MRDDNELSGDAQSSAQPTHVMPVDPDVSPALDDVVSTRTLSFRRQARRTLSSRWDILLVIAAGGALGSLARWGLGEALASGRSSFPWATFLENLSGGFALGVLMVLVVDVWPPSRYVRPFLAVGVLGGFTTFSTYLLDTRALVVAHHAPIAAVYLFGTMAGGLASVWLGIAVPRLLIARTAGRKQRPAPPRETPA